MAHNQQRLTTEQRLQQRLTPLQVQFVRMLEMPQAQAEEEVRRALEEMRLCRRRGGFARLAAPRLFRP